MARCNVFQMMTREGRHCEEAVRPTRQSSLSRPLWIASLTLAMTVVLFMSSSAHAACSSPSGVAGEIKYDLADKMMVYCDDTNWIKMAGDLDPLEIGLIRHWAFEEGSGSTIAGSRVGSHDGTLTNMDENAVWVSGQDGDALEFDGTNDYVVIPEDFGSAMSGENDFSIAFWVNIDVLPTGTGWQDAPILFGPGNEFRFFIALNDGVLDRIKVNCDCVGLGWTSLAESNVLSEDTWYHIVATFNTTDGWKLYQDATEVDSSAYTNTFSTSSASYGNVIGGHTNGTDRYLDGFMDDVRVYNRTLSASEVSDLYTATGGT